MILSKGEGKRKEHVIYHFIIFDFKDTVLVFKGTVPVFKDTVSVKPFKKLTTHIGGIVL